MNRLSALVQRAKTAIARLTKSHVLVAGLGVVSEAVASGVLSGTVQHVAQAVLAAAAALGLAVTPQKAPAPTVSKPAA